MIKEFKFRTCTRDSRNKDKCYSNISPLQSWPGNRLLGAITAKRVARVLPILLANSFLVIDIRRPGHWQRLSRRYKEQN